VIRWFEPGFDISRANSTKDGWKDRSHAFYEWLASYSTQWIGGVDRAFEQICLCIFASRRVALEPMLCRLHMTKCTMIDRPARKEAYNTALLDPKAHGLRLSAAFTGRGEEYRKEMGWDKLKKSDFVDLTKLALKKIANAKSSKSGVVTVTEAELQDNPVLALYLGTGFKWWHDGAAGRSINNHIVVGMVEWTIVFSTRPHLLLLPEIVTFRSLLVRTMRDLDGRPNKPWPRLYDERLLAPEVARLKEKGWVAPPQFGDSEWMLKQVDEQRAMTADLTQVTQLVSKIIKSKYAMAVRPTGTVRGEGALPEWTNLLERRQAMELRTLVNREVYDAGQIFLDTLVENVTQQRLRAARNRLSYPVVFSKDVKYMALPSLKTWDDKYSVETVGDLVEWSEHGEQHGWRMQPRPKEEGEKESDGEEEEEEEEEESERSEGDGKEKKKEKAKKGGEKGGAESEEEEEGRRAMRAAVRAARPGGKGKGKEKQAGVEGAGKAGDAMDVDEVEVGTSGGKAGAGKATTTAGAKTASAATSAKTAAGPSTKAPATTAPKTTAPKAVTATSAAAGGASTSKEGVVGVARTPGEVKAMAQAASRARALERRRKARAEAIVVDEENEGRASPTLPGSSSEEEGVEGTTKGQEKEVGDADAEGEVDEGAAGGDGEIVPATQGADKVDPPTQGPATSAAPAPATEGAGQLPAGTPASPLTQVTETEVEATQRGPTDGRPTDTQMAEPATSQLSMGRLDPIEDVDDDMEGRAPPSTITQFEEPARPATPTVAGGLGKRRAGDLSPQSRNLGQAGRARGHPTPTGEQGGEEEEGSGAFDTQPLRQALS
ncbi:hypothetical protein DENSPDRAFT_887037, partial [Dentipellis sp. KUC8613]